MNTVVEYDFTPWTIVYLFRLIADDRITGVSTARYMSKYDRQTGIISAAHGCEHSFICSLQIGGYDVVYVDLHSVSAKHSSLFAAKETVSIVLAEPELNRRYEPITYYHTWVIKSKLLAYWVSTHTDDFRPIDIPLSSVVS